jgi:hypothetical protein
MTSHTSSDSLCATVYAPPPAQRAWRLEDLFGGSNLRYFSFARRALVEALQIAGVGAGDAVALPALICREVLSALYAVGAKPVFYPVGRRLTLDLPPATVPPAMAILAVNYFGFAQSLAPFQEYCNRTGAVLIEDNAHGLFSRDEQGALLGSRGDLGLFSLRKTIPVPEGSVLALNNKKAGTRLRAQDPFEERRDPAVFQLKNGVRRLVPLLGHRTVHRLISLRHGIRRALTGSLLPLSDPRSEERLPSPARPAAFLARPLRSGDPVKEALRRRELYGMVDRFFKHAGLDLEPVHPSLPEQTVPFGYPFYVTPVAYPPLHAALGQLGLFDFHWPDLPNAIQDKAPAHYQQLRVVSFLW